MSSDAQHLRKLEEFEQGPYTLVVERGKEVLFTSTEERLAPLLEALEVLGPELRGTLVLDRVIGRAAAWLCAAGGVAELLTPLVSEAAVEVLDRYGIRWFARKRVPRILNQSGDGLCPMESLALECQSPEEFLQKLRARQTGKNGV
ncbi:MAG: DUF1893 domain-containing protein [Calditrichaeota bacterium]|nr:DUF1893 domain-containing protein [Calditrichota bacterium]